jgi:hypothetical protein
VERSRLAVIQALLAPGATSCYLLNQIVLPTPGFARFVPYAAFVITAGVLGGCGSKPSPAESAGETPAAASASAQVDSKPKTPIPTAPGEQILIIVDGPGGEKQERWMPAEEARAAGYTLIDLGNDWTPYIFEPLESPDGQALPNRYRRVFIGLANDELDGDGQPLIPGSKNYLELYGIFPSLAVVRERFLEDEAESCLDPEQKEALLAVKRVPWTSPAVTRRNQARQTKLGKQLEKARVRAGVKTLEELADTKQKLAAQVKDYQGWSLNQRALAAAEKRLSCEGLLAEPNAPLTKGRSKHVPGMQDDALRSALRRFQQKHMLYDEHALLPGTLATLAQTRLENDQAALTRAFRERVVAAADVIEDGSTNGKQGPPTYTSTSGEKIPLRNLADEYTRAAAAQLGFDKAETALAFFKRHPHSDFKRLVAGVKLAPRPEYYAPHMELSIVVDRGDVWYDPPFDEEDRWHPQPRQRFPTLTLYLDYKGERVPLTRWRTTIGGWKREQADNGYEYYSYKGSDTGPRVLRKIVSGPVWIAPESTPISGLVRGRTIEGRWQSGVNYDELGPGYLSAYGVVAGYFVVPGQGESPDVDRGIRAHGSSDYLSIYRGGYSHGCHRLPNHLAIRLYDYLLQHRRTITHGDAPMSFARQFLWNDQVYEMRLPSRGFEFELDPPIAVNVLQGTIKGTLQKPVEGMIPKPGKRYPPPPPSEDEADLVTSASGTLPTKAAESRAEP